MYHKLLEVELGFSSPMYTLLIQADGLARWLPALPTPFGLLLLQQVYFGYEISSQTKTLYLENIIHFQDFDARTGT